MKSIVGRFLGCTILFLLALCPPAQAQTIAITGGRVYTGDGQAIENGTVLMRDGRIVAVGADVQIPAGAERVDASGKWVTPGLINALTQLGLIEIGNETWEGELSGNGVAAAFNVYDAINPASQAIPVTRTDGVTTVITAPTGGLISGQAVAMNLLGERVEETVIAEPVAMVAHINQSARNAGGGSRGGVMARLRQVLQDAQEYDRRRDDYHQGRMQPLSAPEADLEALVPVVEGELPLLVTAHRRSDIENALRLGREFNSLKLILVGAREGWIVADELAEAGIPVIINPMDNLPSYDAPSARLDNAALLSEAGVQVLLATFDAHNARNVRQGAGNAVSYGMDWDTALRAVTGDVAAVFGLSDYGTLEAGKVANVVIWSGDPFEFSTAVEGVYINGQKVSEMSRQEALMERYRAMLQQE